MRLMMSQEAAKQQEALEEYVQVLKTYTEKMKGPFFLGDQFSLVDVAVAPWIMRDYVIVENRGFTRGAPGTKWKEYSEKVESRDSVKNVMSVSVPAMSFNATRGLTLLTGERKIRQHICPLSHWSS